MDGSPSLRILRFPLQLIRSDSGSLGRKPVSVTPQEYQVLFHILQGHTTLHIAKTLRLKPATVRSYLQSLYRKTGTSTRPALVWWLAYQLSNHRFIRNNE